MRTGHTTSLGQIQTMFMETFGLGRVAALVVFVLIVLVTVFTVFWFFYSAPPDTIIMTSGPEGSFFQRNAEKYRTVLAHNGVKLKIVPSQGSLENLKRLADRSFHVDIGFVQGGLSNGVNIEDLISLGSISYEPLLIFYRGTRVMDLLSQLVGKRLAIGPVGSGTRSLALALLAANGITPGGETAMVDHEAPEAAKALIEQKIDAVFLMGDAASPDIMRALLLTPGVTLFDFAQADAYTRRFVYLSRLELPKGSVDLGKNIPSHDVSLIGPTVEIIARTNLHPALSDLLLETAREIHGNAGVFKRKGEFPAPLEHEFRISSDAARYYKSGKSFLYRYLPFWLASLANRILLVAVPLFVLLVPGVRIIPAIYRWRIHLRIYRWYRALLVLEQDVIARPGNEKREELLERLDRIEEDVKKMRVPASFADQFYQLRAHIRFVHNLLSGEKHSPHTHT